MKTRHRIFLLCAVPAALLASCGGEDVVPHTQPVPPPADVQVQGCVEGVFTPYLGVLHAHTGYSDGVLTPAEAFAHGRDEGGLDILVITDHLEQIYIPLPADRKWERCREQADAAYEPGRFLADCGFEYGSGFSSLLPPISTGHNNVFFSEGLFPFIQLDYRDFYRSLAACGPCIGQFNHPGYRDSEYWNDFEYVPEVDEKMNLFEFNGGGPVWDLLFLALDAGWHVSPTYNQDNHSADWGTRNERRSGLFMTELTRPAMREAMQNRRTFMSHDRNATIRMTAFGKCWMGSILSGEMPASMTLEVEVHDPDPEDGWTAVEIFGPGMERLAVLDCGGETTCRGSFTFEARTATYFVARATQEDGHWLVAAPLWIYPE